MAKRKQGVQRSRTVIKRESLNGSTVYSKNGTLIRSKREIDRINNLAIPPAWNNVEIAESPRAKVLARGVDEAGRTQAIYHPTFRRKQERDKFERILRFAEDLPKLRKQVDKDLRRRKLSRQKIVACIIKLMDQQFFRVGNTRYAKEHGSYGISTLRRKHVSTTPTTVTFDFVGKSGKRHRRKIRDPQVARIIEQLVEMPGYEIFRFFDQDGIIHNVESRHVNDYVKNIMGDDFSAKDFRTWGGTLLAVSALLSSELSAKETKPEMARTMRRVVDEVADRLGNTPAVTKSSYIDPRVFETYNDGVTMPKLKRAMSRMRPRQYLSVEEQCVLKVLRQR